MNDFDPGTARAQGCLPTKSLLSAARKSEGAIFCEPVPGRTVSTPRARRALFAQESTRSVCADFNMTACLTCSAVHAIVPIASEFRRLAQQVVDTRLLALRLKLPASALLLDASLTLSLLQLRLALDTQRAQTNGRFTHLLFAKSDDRGGDLA